MTILSNPIVTAAFTLVVVWCAGSNSFATEHPSGYLALVEELVSSEGSIAVVNKIEQLDTKEHPLTVAPLLPLLQHPSSKVRQGAAYTVRLMQNVQGGTTELLDAARKEQTVPALIEMIQGLGAARATTATPLLSELMVDHRSPHIRYAAVEAEYWICDTNAVPALIRATEDPSDNIAVRSLYVLGHIGDSRAIARLIKLAQGRDVVKQMAAVQALGMIGSPEAAPVLCSLLNSDDTLLLKNAVWALGRAHDGATVAALLPLLGHSNEAVVKETCSSLIEIGNNEVLVHFIDCYNKNPADTLARGILRSIYLQRYRTLGDTVEELPKTQMTALVKCLSNVSGKNIESIHIKAIHRITGGLFVRVAFDQEGAAFILSHAEDGTFNYAAVISSWIF